MKQQFRARFRALTIVQIAFLAGSISMLAWSLFATEFLAVPVAIAIVILLQVIGLIHYVESHVNTLEDFFAAQNKSAGVIFNRPIEHNTRV